MKLENNKNIKELEVLQKEMNDENKLLIDQGRRVLTSSVNALYLYRKKERYRFRKTNTKGKQNSIQYI